MQSDKTFFDDMAKLAGSTIGVMEDFKKDCETMVRGQVQSFVERMDLVSREEFDVVREMAAKAREENELLKKELEMLKKNTSATKKPTKKAANKTTSKSKNK